MTNRKDELQQSIKEMDNESSKARLKMNYDNKIIANEWEELVTSSSRINDEMYISDKL